MVMEDLTWGGEHTGQYTDDVIKLYKSVFAKMEMPNTGLEGLNDTGNRTKLVTQ